MEGGQIIDMKKYSIYGVINGNGVNIKKQFNSRYAAIEYMFKYLDRHYIYNFQIEEEREVEKHSIEYLYNDSNRFIVTRVSC